jgi:UDP-3-O-[3-hydroxymyristoyl] glucosamine N-acyltransferase
MKSLTVREIADLVEGTLEGEGERVVEGVKPLKTAGEHDLSFLSQDRHVGEVPGCKAAVILLPPKAEVGDRPVIRVPDPQKAVVQVIAALELEDRSHPFEGIHEHACVDEEAELADGVSVGPFATVCAGARIGRNTVLYPGVFVGPGTVLGEACVLLPNACVMRQCTLGNRVTLGPGAIVGSAGFGFHPTPEGSVRIPQLGTVILEDDVHVGANTTIDRARFDATHVRKGAAFDNLVQIGHNCSVGPNTIIASQSGLGGGTKLGAHCLLAGQIGVAAHVEIGDHTMIGAKSGVAGSFREGNVAISGYYAKEHRESLRDQAAQRRLPELIERVRKIEKRLA